MCFLPSVILAQYRMKRKQSYKVHVQTNAYEKNTSFFNQNPFLKVHVNQCLCKKHKVFLSEPLLRYT